MRDGEIFFFFQMDGTLGVFHTHAVAGLTGLLAKSELCRLILPEPTRGAFYGGSGWRARATTESNG